MAATHKFTLAAGLLWCVAVQSTIDLDDYREESLRCMGVYMMILVGVYLKWAAFDEVGDPMATGRLADGSIVAFNGVDIIGVDWQCNLVPGRIFDYMSQ